MTSIELTVTTARIEFLRQQIQAGKVALEEVRKDFPPKDIEALEALIRKPDEEYLDHILRITRTPLARLVEIHNLRQRIDKLTGGSLKDKYVLALYLLMNLPGERK